MEGTLIGQERKAILLIGKVAQFDPYDRKQLVIEHAKADR